MSIDLYSSSATLPPPKNEAEELQSEAKAESELQSEAIAESEPDLKRPRLELKDIDDDVEESEVSSMAMSDLDYDPEDWGFAQSGTFEPEVDSENPDDLELSDVRAMYDDNPYPVAFRNKRFSSKNPALINELKAYDEYMEQARKQPTGPWDYTPSPENLRLVGGVRPYDITDDDRPRFIHYCNLSLNKYNAENQGANFVFSELVKSTSIVSCPRYFITFMTKDASNNCNEASTFQAEVVDKLFPNGMEPEVLLCMRKPN